MYKYYIFNQPTYSAKRALRFFIRNNREGCKIHIMPYNNQWCNIEIALHPNHAYCVIMNYIADNKDSLKCSDKAKQFINSNSTYNI